MTTTTAPDTIPGLTEAIDAAWEHRQDGRGPSLLSLLSDAMTDTAYHFSNALWVRSQACDDPECPNRPAWDIALTPEADDALHAARDEAIALIRDRMADFARRFQAEHPEAVIRKP